LRFTLLENCKEDMVVAENIYCESGNIFIKKSEKLTKNHLDFLNENLYSGLYIEDNFSNNVKINYPISPSLRNKLTISIKKIFEAVHQKKVLNYVEAANFIFKLSKNLINEIPKNKILDFLYIRNLTNYTFEHSVDTAIISVVIGKNLNFEKEKLLELCVAALFHNIGNMYISKKLLDLDHKFSQSELEEIQKHTKLGYDLLKNTFKTPKNIYEVALTHHERYDGTGYPLGLSSEEIPIFSRIISLSDWYNAITTKRSYRNAFISIEAFEYISSNAGLHFDPNIVKIFVSKISPYPAGTTIILSDGRKGVVIENNESILTRPYVKTYGVDKTPTIIDLLEETTLTIKSII